MDFGVGFGENMDLALVVGEVFDEERELPRLPGSLPGLLEKTLSVLGQLDLIDDVPFREDGSKHVEVLKGAAELLLSEPNVVGDVVEGLLSLSSVDVMLRFANDQGRSNKDPTGDG